VGEGGGKSFPDALRALKRVLNASYSLLISPYRRTQKYHLEIKTFSEEISQIFCVAPTHKIIRIICHVIVTDPIKRKNCPNIYSMATGAIRKDGGSEEMI
jgi:hypothetical protein